MKGRGGVMASPNQIRSGNLTIKIKRGGTGGTGGSGPSGYKTTPSHLLQRALCERAGVNIAAKLRQAQRIAAKTTPIRLWGGFWGLDKDGNKTGVAA